MDKFMNAIEREKKVISLMIDMYCKKNHQAKGECSYCEELKAFAFKRIDKCRFKADKPNCNDCKVHCFGREKREQIKEVMRYSGPRMMFKHPYYALLHLMRRKKETLHYYNK